MESNDSAFKYAEERPIPVGADGAACSIRAVELAAREAAQNDVPLVVSAYQEMPEATGLVAEGVLLHESAEAAVADAKLQAQELEPSVVVRGETVLDAPGPALARLSKGATALSSAREATPRSQESSWDLYPSTSCTTLHATRRGR